MMIQPFGLLEHTMFNNIIEIHTFLNVDVKFPLEKLIAFLWFIYKPNMTDGIIAFNSNS